MHSASRRTAKVFAALALLVFSAFAVSACAGSTAADTWLKPNQNARNTRYTGGRISTDTINTVAVGWTADLRTKAGNGASAPSPIITQKTVFVENAAGRPVAFDLQTGAVRAGLTFKLNQAQSALGGRSAVSLLKFTPDISPILTLGNDDAPIIVGARGNSVAALNVKGTGKAWSRKLSSPSNTRPVVISNMAAAHQKIYAPVANVPTDVASRGLSAVVQQVTASNKNNGQLVAIDATNGKVSWTKKLASVPLGAATVVNDIVFTSTLDGHLYGFNADNGDQVFESLLPAGAVAPIAVYNATIIVPATFVSKKGQRPQVVAFTIGGLGEIGGAAAPKIKQQSAGKVAGAATGQQATSGAKPAGPDGKAIFASAGCAGCHTLKAASASGTAGPNLDNLKPSDAAVIKQVTNGGGGMPAFKGRLSAAEIAALAKFVSQNAGK